MDKFKYGRVDGYQEFIAFGRKSGWTRRRIDAIVGDLDAGESEGFRVLPGGFEM